MFDEKIGLLTGLSIAIVGAVTAWVIYVYVQANVPQYMVYFLDK